MSRAASHNPFWRFYTHFKNCRQGASFWLSRWCVRSAGDSSFSSLIRFQIIVHYVLADETSLANRRAGCIGFRILHKPNNPMWRDWKKLHSMFERIVSLGQSLTKPLNTIVLWWFVRFLEGPQLGLHDAERRQFLGQLYVGSLLFFQPGSRQSNMCIASLYIWHSYITYA